MNPVRQCPSCASHLDEGDRFCPSCGRTLIEAPAQARASLCPLCGQDNPPTSSSCSSCGAKLREAVPPSPATKPAGSSAAREVAPFQGWKFTLIVAAGLIALLAILVASQPGPEHVHAPAAPAQADPHDAVMMERLRELQARLETNPNDAPATLEFANILYDVRFFERAAEMYDRYLALEPGNADARVDLGTSYFQMSRTDSSASAEFLAKAEASFLEAVRLQPRHQLAHFNLGILRLQQRDMAGARSWFGKCVAIDSTSESGRRAKELMSEHVQPNSPSP